MWLFLALLSCSLAAEVTLIVRYPSSNLKGQSLYIRGDALGLNWNQGVQLSYQGSDTWSIALSYSPSGTSSLNFKTLVGDSVWQIGANEQVSLSSSTTSFTSYPFFFTEEGNYAVTTSLQSERLGNSRDVIVYYPPSYFENTLKIYSDVLIMHDGQNIFNDSTSFGGRSWRCKETIDQLINEGNMREVLVVGLYNTPNRIDEYTYSKDPQYGGGNGNIYLDFIESRALPWIQKNLRVATNPRYGILGSSLGGLISCYAGWTRSHVYSIAGCMSSSFWWNSQDFNTTVLSLPKPPASTFFYLDSGDSGPSKDDEVETITVRDHVLNLGWQEGENLWYFLARGGTHNEYSWGERFYVPMTDLYPPLPLEN